MNHPSIHQWLVEHTPLEPSLLEGPGFEAVIAERLAAVADGDESTYIAALRSSPDELDRLAAEVAVPETWLFRYPNSFNLLVDVLRRRLAAGETAVRMRSIGCATGQEPYCMAMAALHAGWSEDQISVEGLDRNPEVLKIAVAGKYGASSIRSELPTWSAPFLQHDGDAIRIDARVRRIVRFTRADATISTGEDPCHVIFCRNVLIYLNAGARGRLLDSICSSLAPGGVLFVGHAEQLISGRPVLRPIPSPHSFALERFDPSRGTSSHQEHPRPVQAKAIASHSAAAAASPSARRTSRSEPERAPDVTIEDARDLADAGSTQQSETMIRSIIARRGPSAAALELLGLIRIAANDAASAKKCFEQAVYLEPARPASLLQLAMMSERDGDAARAAMLWDRARRASESNKQERQQ